MLYALSFISPNPHLYFLTVCAAALCCENKKERFFIDPSTWPRISTEIVLEYDLQPRDCTFSAEKCLKIIVNCNVKWSPKPKQDIQGASSYWLVPLLPQWEDDGAQIILASWGGSIIQKDVADYRQMSPLLVFNGQDQTSAQMLHGGRLEVWLANRMAGRQAQGTLEWLKWRCTCCHCGHLALLHIENKQKRLIRDTFAK